MQDKNSPHMAFLFYQQNHDWAALESFKRNHLVLIVKKVVENQKIQVIHWSLATKLSKNAGTPNLSLFPLKQ